MEKIYEFENAIIKEEKKGNIRKVYQKAKQGLLSDACVGSLMHVPPTTEYVAAMVAIVGLA